MVTEDGRICRWGGLEITLIDVPGIERCQQDFVFLVFVCVRACVCAPMVVLLALRHISES